METFIRLLWIGLGGAIGAILRSETALLVVRLFPKHTWLGTMVANIIGCVAFAFLKAWMDEQQIGIETTRLFVFTGLLGAYTTFSTFESDAWGLWSGGGRGLAIAYVTASVALGFSAFAIISTVIRPAS